MPDNLNKDINNLTSTKSVYGNTAYTGGFTANIGEKVEKAIAEASGKANSAVGRFIADIDKLSKKTDNYAQVLSHVIGAQRKGITSEHIAGTLKTHFGSTSKESAREMMSALGKHLSQIRSVKGAAEAASTIGIMKNAGIFQQAGGAGGLASMLGGAWKANAWGLAIDGLIVATRTLEHSFINLGGRVEQQRSLVAGGVIDPEKLYGTGGRAGYRSDLSDLNTFITSAKHMYSLDESEIPRIMAKGIKDQQQALNIALIAKGSNVDPTSLAQNFRTGLRRFTGVSNDAFIQYSMSVEKLGVTGEELQGSLQNLMHSVQGTVDANKMYTLAGRAAQMEAKGQMAPGEAASLLNIGRGSTSSMVGVVALLRQRRIGGFGDQDFNTDFNRFMRTPPTQSTDWIKQLTKYYDTTLKPVARSQFSETMFGVSGTGIYTVSEKLDRLSEKFDTVGITQKSLGESIMQQERQASYLLNIFSQKYGSMLMSGLNNTNNISKNTDIMAKNSNKPAVETKPIWY